MVVVLLKRFPFDKAVINSCDYCNRRIWRKPENTNVVKRFHPHPAASITAAFADRVSPSARSALEIQQKLCVDRFGHDVNWIWVARDWDEFGSTPMLQNLSMNPIVIATARMMESNRLIEPPSDWVPFDWTGRNVLPDSPACALAKPPKTVSTVLVTGCRSIANPSRPSLAASLRNSSVSTGASFHMMPPTLILRAFAAATPNPNMGKTNKNAMIAARSPLA